MTRIRTRVQETCMLKVQLRYNLVVLTGGISLNLFNKPNFLWLSLGMQTASDGKSLIFT